MPLSSGFRVADLDQNSPNTFELAPDEAACAGLAGALGLMALRKLRFKGKIEADGARDWRLRAELGATVVQACVVTLEPVTTRIDTDVSRRYIADFIIPDEAETEMPEDDSIEPLRDVIDPAAVMAEALAIALPDYPRKDGVELGEAVFAEDGAAPLREADVKPFAGLAALRDKMRDSD